MSDAGSFNGNEKDYGEEIDSQPEYNSEVDILSDNSHQTERVNEKPRGKRIPDEERGTSRFMTKYERARILGTRALQISKNAPLMIDPADESDPYRLAEIELQEKKVPFIIRRYLPDGAFEDWKVAELFVE